MKLNQKGFTLVELIGVIAISSIIIAPLLFSLVGNFEVNTRQIKRSAASLVNEAALVSVQSINFREINELMANAQTSSEMYVVLNAERCDLFDNTESKTYDTVITYFGGSLSILNEQANPRGGGARAVCNEIFTINVIDEGFETEDFLVFIYPFIVDQAFETEWNTALNSNMPGLDKPIPDRVLTELERVSVVEDPIGNIYRVLVYTRYSTRDGDVLVRSGLMTPQWAPEARDEEDNNGD